MASLVAGSSPACGSNFGEWRKINTRGGIVRRDTEAKTLDSDGDGLTYTAYKWCPIAGANPASPTSFNCPVIPDSSLCPVSALDEGSLSNAICVCRQANQARVSASLNRYGRRAGTQALAAGKFNFGSVACKEITGERSSGKSVTHDHRPVTHCQLNFTIGSTEGRAAKFGGGASSPKARKGTSRYQAQPGGELNLLNVGSDGLYGPTRSGKGAMSNQFKHERQAVNLTATSSDVRLQAASSHYVQLPIRYELRDDVLRLFILSAWDETHGGTCVQSRQRDTRIKTAALTTHAENGATRPYAMDFQSRAKAERDRNGSNLSASFGAGSLTNVPLGSMLDEARKPYALNPTKSTDCYSAPVGIAWRSPEREPKGFRIRLVGTI